MIAWPKIPIAIVPIPIWKPKIRFFFQKYTPNVIGIPPNVTILKIKFIKNTKKFLGTSSGPSFSFFVILVSFFGDNPYRNFEGKSS